MSAFRLSACQSFSSPRVGFFRKVRTRSVSGFIKLWASPKPPAAHSLLYLGDRVQVLYGVE